MSEVIDVLVVGGGAAGFFGAIQCIERNPALRVVILEKSEKVLSKVRISGGGRCNVTHACFDPEDLCSYYPRGNKELLGPFHRFMCGDMMAWLDEHGVATHIEEDGRVFPVSNQSETIIDCFESICRNNHLPIITGCGVQSLERKNNQWEVHTSRGVYVAHKVLFTTGSSPAAWKLLSNLGHNIIEPVPSLFTFNIQHHLLTGLPGIALENVEATLPGTPWRSEGPLLITHWGLSGPAVLKLSSWGARELAARNYRFPVIINWCHQDPKEIYEHFQLLRLEQGKRQVAVHPQFGLPKRLWQRMAEVLKMGDQHFGDLSAVQVDKWITMLTACELPVNGKSTFKDEFVTCGGVDTREVHFTTMESKLQPGLYFAGEVLNIDALTGGFNFQAAWTGAWIAAAAIAG